MKSEVNNLGIQSDPTDETLVPKLKLATGQPIRLLVTTPSALRAAWATAYPQA